MVLDEAATDAALARVREICCALPEVTERESHSAPTWFVRTRVIVHFWDDHHGDGRVALWVPAATGVQDDLVDTEPDRFFVPPYVGHRGWLGVRLDVDVDWDEISQIIADGYRCVAPKALIRQLDEEERTS